MNRSGIILINKNTNQKSFDIIRDLRKILNIKKIGHTGTIDKDQSGLMVCLLNDATKYVDILQKYEKEYIIELIFGIETDTEDIYGKIVDSCDNINISINELNKTLNNFIGEYNQIPPMYSQKKINGNKLLSLAHKNINIDRKPNKVNIYNIEIIDEINIDNELNNNNAIYFIKNDIKDFENKYQIKLKKYYLKVSCSKGCYMRTLCKDIGTMLNTYATMGSLVRVKNSNFNLKDALTIEDIETKVKNNDYSFIKPCYYTDKKQIVTFGKFETIHIGHQKILKEVVNIAKTNSLESTVLIIDDNTNKNKIYSKEQIYTYIKNIGIDNIKYFKLYDDIKKWDGEYFVKEILIKQLNSTTIVVGEDCSFGYKGLYKIDDLINICKKYNVKVIKIEKLKINYLDNKIINNNFLNENKNEYISSTIINKCYELKNIDAIEILTNRVYRERKNNEN